VGRAGDAVSYKMPQPAAASKGAGGGVAEYSGRTQFRRRLRICLAGALRACGRYILAKEEYQNRMKRIACVLLTVAGLVSGCLIAQDRPWSRRASAISPEANAKADFGGKAVGINYSAPSLRDPKKLNDPSGQPAPDRALFDIMKGDRTMPVWRAGAQDATLLRTDADLDIGGLTVPKGEYTLFINLEDKAKWQLVVNKQIHQWGLTYDKTQDLGRVPMTMGKPPARVETLKWSVTSSSASQGAIQLEWENVSASVPFTVK